jgi:hypothetical protein
MTREELKQFIKEHSTKKLNSNLFRKSYSKYNNEAYESLINNTSYLNSPTISERVYHIMNDLYEYQNV